jgi:hypothetical protein
MTTTTITLTEAQLDALFPLVPNHLNPPATWSVDEGPGCLFETVGPELDFVRQQDPRRVWTLVDSDERQHLLSGIHFVNRIGYLVSRVSLPEGVNAVVTLECVSDG